MNDHGKHAQFVPLRPPGLVEVLLESRALLEYGAGIAATPLLRLAPRGDGHPVLVFPGMGASDSSTSPLRRFLRSRGYLAHAWRLGRNLGPTPEVVAQSRARIRALRQRHGRRVSLIGWSLGGIYARELAKAMPEDIRMVITLGTPFAGHPRATNAWRLFEMLNGRRRHDPGRLDSLRRPPPMPTTSIYSRTDGIVAWQCSVEREGPRAENIEVEASHTGMGVHPAVLYAVADRLAQPEGAWRPFTRTGWRRLIYPDPHRPACFGAARPSPT